jgi:hypothetical protein
MSVFTGLNVRFAKRKATGWPGRMVQHCFPKHLKMKPALCVLAVFAVGALNLSALAQPTNIMNPNKTELATFGGGCFWCMEAVFERLPGVKSVTSGFAGGHTANPTYPSRFAPATTGHAEVTQIEFDPGENLLRKAARRFLAGA